MKIAHLPFAAALVAAACSSTATPPATTPDAPDTSEFKRPPYSCAYMCPSSGCAEVGTPYSCPAMAPWAGIPHEAACGDWDGGYPAAAPGHCVASAPAGAAAAYAGTVGGVTILPDGRTLSPAGADWVFAENDLVGGLTSGLLRVPGTQLVLAVDTGEGDHAVRLINTAKIGSGDPVASYVRFANPSTLNSAVAYVAPDLIYVATNDGVIQALKIDLAAATLARDPARTIKLPESINGNGIKVPWYVAGLAASPDGKRLVATGVTERRLLAYDVDAQSPGFGSLLGSVELGASETFSVSIDPADLAGNRAYVTMWDRSKVVEVDLTAPGAPVIAREFPTKKNPQGVAFLGPRWMVAAGDLGDALTLIDRASGQATDVRVDATQPLYGLEPGALAFDSGRSRLYAALGGINAVAVFDVDLSKSPPALVPLGRMPTGFWPSALAVEDDGALIVTNLRGRGTGTRPVYWPIDDSDIADHMRGSIQRVPLLSAAELAATDAVVAKSLSVGARDGAPQVTCPDGARDFPLPATNTEGPSPVIKHVFVVLRENKGFDGVFGDMPGVNGEPTFALKPGSMDGIWKNLRQAARTFAMSDNYYTDAIYSTQGHVWATYGRTSDFNERTWAISGSGRSARPVPGGGVIDVGQPVEGSLFDWLGDNHVAYDIRGEIDGSPRKPPTDHPPLDAAYPGGPFQNIGYNDLEKACYLAAQLRVFCNLGTVTYLTLPNDHTFGVSPQRPTPETYCAVNDEATGMFLDALSHSPAWASSVVLITEDDPSQGGEHVDSHRAPLTLVSPWIRRGYVSHTHIDIASVHKLIAHLVGKPYPNAIVAQAALPFDAFTSTPDFAPFVYARREWPLSCGDGAAKGERDLSDSWDFSREDAQPGLDQQVSRWMRGAPAASLSPALRARVEARIEGNASRAAR